MRTQPAGQNGRLEAPARVIAALVMASFVVVVPSSLPAGAAVPDQALAWNQHAYNELIVTAAQPPPVAALHLAMVHGAIYDAVNAIDGGHEPYLGAPTAQPSFSTDAAAAAAAYRVLLHLLPGRSTQLTGYYDASLAAIPDGPAETGGVGVGEAAAAAMIAARTGDGRPVVGQPVDALFSVGTDAGDWRPIAAGANNFKWVGEVLPFVIDDAEDFATAGPLPLGSAKYATEFNQVKRLGRATGSTRTPDQTAQALFWSDHTVAIWNRMFRQVSISQELTTTENARYFAMLYTTGSDALIACFQDKERWGFWRPQTAIRLAGDDGNGATAPDPAWTSLIANPPYPDHPSGANCVTSAFVETLRDFFGTNTMAFSGTNATQGITRRFRTFSQAANEVRLARVYGGLHFMTADAQAVTLGKKVASYRQGHAFGPA